jgi:hypothetical protein
MKISALFENRKRLFEGGNLSINGHEAQHLDLKVTKRGYMVPKLNELLYAINSAYFKMYKESLWNDKVLASGEFLSGSSLHFFNVKGISDEVFTQKKPTVGDIDTMVDKTKEPNLQQFLTAYTNKQIGPAVFLGFQRGNEQFSGLFELQDPPVKVQIDFEFVEFEKEKPTDWARFSHSSSWEDLQAGVKGVFHKWLIQAFTALTRKNFILRKMKGRGKLRQEVDEPATDNMYSFAVSSKEGGGLRAKYEPVLDDNGNPLVIKGLPVMREAPTSGYNQDIGQIFSTILDQRLNPKQAQTLQKQFWSFTGLLQVMNTLLTTEEKEQVMQGFLSKTIGPGAQGMYKNNPNKDIAEKTVAINTLLNTLKLPKPSNLDQMLDTYRKSYSMTPADGGKKPSTDVVKSMAKNTLDEAVPSYKRKGIQHIYNPGSSTEMKDADFINFCKEIVQDGGKFAGVPINLKVDGAGIRFGRTPEGEPFFMTSRVETPMTKANIGDFEKYGRSQGQSDEQLARTQNYDKALSTIVNADFMKDIPPDTIVQAEMLFNPMAQQDSGGYKFVNIPYDPKKLGKVMTLIPISIKQYSTGEQSPDADEIKEALIKDSTPNIKMVNNTLSHKDIDVSKIVNPIVKNAEALTKAVSQRGDSPDKQKAKAILSTARQALSKAIINSPIPGKDQLGDMIEGLVINMPSGTLAKVTSPDMQEKMADKQAMNKKPTEGSNRTKPAVVTIGSFVGHKGHEQLINQTIETAERVGGDPYIYVSPVVGPDDPIPPADKVKTLQKLYPQYAKNIQVWNPQGTPVKKIEKELVLPANSPYNKIILLVGDDRYEGFKNWMDSLEKRMKDPAAIAKYGGTQNQVDFETIRTERDPSKGGTGISFTQLRDKLKEPNTNEQDKLKFWMQAFDTDKLGADWVKHLMDTTAKNMGIQQQAIKEYIQKIKPMLEYATPTQKIKIYNQLAEAKQKLSEMGEPSSNNLANVVAKLINSKKPEIFSRYGDKKVMDTIIDTCTNNVGKTEMELAVEAMTKLKHFVKEDYDRSMLRDGFSTEQEINGILYKAVGKSFKGSYGGTLTITAYDKNKKIGMAQFTDHFEKSGLESLSTDVDPAYQRQGIASTMYAYARMLGNTIHPSIVQTKQGEKMWKGWKKSGDAKFLKKESVAERMKMGATNEPIEEDKEVDPVVDATIKFYTPVMQKAQEQEVDHYVEKARHLLQKTDDPAVRKKLIDIFKEGKHNPYLQGGIITAIAALLGGGAINVANSIQLTPYQTNLMMQGILNSIVPAVGARMSGKNWVDTLKYTLASLGVGVGIATVMEKESDVIGHVAKDLAGDGAPIAKLRAARDSEQMKKRERSDGLPVEPKFDYLDEK